MDSTIKSVWEGLGPKSELEKKVLSLADVKKMVDRDLPVAIALLEAIRDKDVSDAVAVYLHGKYLNARHREELDSQLNLERVKANQ